MYSLVKLLLLIPLSGVEDLQSKSFFEREQTQNRLQTNLNYFEVLRLEYQFRNGIIQQPERRRRVELIIENYWRIPSPPRADGKWPYIDALNGSTGVYKNNCSYLYEFVYQAAWIVGKQDWPDVYPVATQLFAMKLIQKRIPKQVIRFILSAMEVESNKYDTKKRIKRK